MQVGGGVVGGRAYVSILPVQPGGEPGFEEEWRRAVMRGGEGRGGTGHGN